MGVRSVTAALAALLSVSTVPFAEAGPFIVVEYGSGRVVEQEEATRPWYPASLSKLMTAYVVFQAIEEKRIDLGTPILISKRAAKMAPSKMGYPAGTLVTVDDALKMLIVQSANDIAVALAENVSGSVDAFALEMNRHSRALGMTQSHWVNPNGLPDPRQISSARDMAILSRAILSDFPQYAGYFKIHAIKSGKRVMRTHNALVYRYPGADGMKTGFICAGGFNVVATATRGGKKLITVVLGSPSAKERTRKAAALFEDGFGGGWFRSTSTLAQLSPSPYATPTDIRELACGKRRKTEAAADAEDAPAKPMTRGLKAEGVMATLMQAPPTAPDGPLLTSWTIAPPIPVGPYKGPRRPPQLAILEESPEDAAPQSVDEAFKAVQQARAPAVASPGAVSSYAEPTPAKPMVLPSDPAASTLPDQVPAAPPGAIRPGVASAAPQGGMPGQIERANPLQSLPSEPFKPLPGKPQARTTTAEGIAVPIPVPRPDEPQARPAPRKKAKAGKRG